MEGPPGQIDHAPFPGRLLSCRLSLVNRRRLHSRLGSARYGALSEGFHGAEVEIATGCAVNQELTASGVIDFYGMPPKRFPSHSAFALEGANPSCSSIVSLSIYSRSR